MVAVTLRYPSAFRRAVKVEVGMCLSYGCDGKLGWFVCARFGKYGPFRLFCFSISAEAVKGGEGKRLCDLSGTRFNLSPTKISVISTFKGMFLG